jgi:hypothetical protein
MPIMQPRHLAAIASIFRGLEKPPEDSRDVVIPPLLNAFLNVAQAFRDHPNDHPPSTVWLSCPQETL